MTKLYNCRHDGDQFRITKFDTDMNVEASYLLNAHECECPASARDTCRHRQMLPKFIARGAVGTEWFYDHDRGGWVQLALPGAEPGGGREQASVRDEASDVPDRMWMTVQEAVDKFGVDAESSAIQPTSIDRRGR